MLRYIAQRLLAGLLTAFIVSLLIFALLRIAIDQEDFAAIEPLGGVSLRPTEEQRWTIRERLGLNAPLHIQYFRWMGGWITGEWAESSFSGEEIWESFIPRLPTTLQLVATAQAIVVLAGIPAGIIMALKRNSWIDTLGLAISRMWLGLPIFWTSTLLLVGGVYFLEWKPNIGYIPPLDDLSGNLILFVWPSLVLSFPVSAAIATLMRSSMLDIVQQDYVETTPASGLGHSASVLLHTLRSSLVPATIILGLTFPAIVSGTVVMERIFVLDGVGNLLFAGMNQRDYPVIESLALFFAVWVVAVNTLVDLACGWLTPDVRSSRKSPREEWDHLANPVRLV